MLAAVSFEVSCTNTDKQIRSFKSYCAVIIVTIETKIYYQR